MLSVAIYCSKKKFLGDFRGNLSDHRSGGLRCVGSAILAQITNWFHKAGGVKKK